MIAAELMIFLADAMKVLTNVGIKMKDCNYLSLWKEYESIVAEGGKKGYAEAVLAERHHISERTVKRIIRRFKRELPQDKKCHSDTLQ